MTQVIVLNGGSADPRPPSGALSRQPTRGRTGRPLYRERSSVLEPAGNCGDRGRPVGVDDVTDWRGGGGSLALDPSQPVRGRPPLDDEHRGLLVEVGVHDLGDVGVEAVAVRSFGDRSGGDQPAGDLRLARPLRLGALDRVHRGAVQGEPRIPAEIRALARVRHRAKNQFAVLEDRLNPGNSRRPVGSQGGKCLVPVSVEQCPDALRELWLCLFDILPRRHAPMIAPLIGRTEAYE